MNLFNRKNLFWISYALILLIALVIRLYHLSDRVFHNDEAVNHFFLQRISQIGYYPYSHQNYHGPAYFYLSWFFYAIFGDSEFVIRLSAVLSGVCAAALPLMLRKHCGSAFVLISSALLSFSSASVYFNRYAIHESTFLLWTLLLVFSLFLYLQEFKAYQLLLSAIAAALLISTKETFIITFFCVFLAYLPFFWLKFKELKNSLNQKVIALALGAFLLCFIICFTGLFRWSLGVREFLHGIPQWVARNSSDSGHFKDWGYYLSIVAGTPFTDFFKWGEVSLISRWRDVPYAAEPQTLIALILLIPAFIYEIYSLVKKRRWSFGGVLVIWTASVWFIYSVPVKYKTPWLIINLTFPALLSLAWYLSLFNRYLEENYAAIGKGLFAFVLSALFLLTLNSTYILNYIYPLGDRNPYAYVHSYQNLKNISGKILKYCESKKDCNVLIGLNAYWPLPYYLRNLNGRVYYKKDPVSELEESKYPVLLLNPGLRLDPSKWSYQYFRLSEVQEGEVWFRK